MNTTHSSKSEIEESIEKINGGHGLLDTLFNILNVADEEGYHVESDTDRANDIQANLNLATQELHSESPNLVETLNHLEAARSATGNFRRELDQDLSKFNPDQVDFEGRDSLHQHANYVEHCIITTIGMTDEAIEHDKEDYQIDINNVELHLSDELEGIDIHVAERNMGDGREFAIEALEEDSANQLWQSTWYQKDKFEAFCSGMEGLRTLLRHAADGQADTSE